MRKDIQIGITETVTVSTASSYRTSTFLGPWYDAYLYDDENGRIVARCTDLQGAVTDGANEEEAITNLMEAIKGIRSAKL